MTLLQAWVDQLQASADLQTLLEGWVELLEPALGGEEWAQGELLQLLGFYARGQGLEGKPVSASLRLITALEEALNGAAEASRTSWRPLTQQLCNVMVDSHALGQTQRLQNRHLAALKRSAPVFSLAGVTTVGFLQGPMEAELLDALFGRVLRLCARGHRFALIDCVGAEPDDERFHRTVRGFLERWLENPGPAERKLALSGLVSADRTREALLALGCAPDHLLFYENVDQALDALSIYKP